MFTKWEPRDKWQKSMQFFPNFVQPSFVCPNCLRLLESSDQVFRMRHEMDKKNGMKCAIVITKILNGGSLSEKKSCNPSPETCEQFLLSRVVLE